MTSASLCPRRLAPVDHSQSPQHRDGTEAYAAKATRPLRFHDADIEADPELVRRTVTG
jgi:hypothetical protein